MKRVLLATTFFLSCLVFWQAFALTEIWSPVLLPSPLRVADYLYGALRDGSLVHAYRNRAQARVKEAYDWDYVVDRYEDLFAKMAGVSLPARIQLVKSERITTVAEATRSASA